MLLLTHGQENRKDYTRRVYKYFAIFIVLLEHTKQ